jgi:hypothetical protein
MLDLFYSVEHTRPNSQRAVGRFATSIHTSISPASLLPCACSVFFGLSIQQETGCHLFRIRRSNGEVRRRNCLPFGPAPASAHQSADGVSVRP